MKIAFIIQHFPSLSQTFILNQITGLIDLGHKVDIFAFDAEINSKIPEDVRKYNLPEHTSYRNQIFESMQNSYIFRFQNALKGIIKFMPTRSESIIKSLNIFKYGRKAASLSLLMQILPFLEKGPYDIFHCHFGPLGNYGIFLKEVGAIQGKLITTIHGFDITRQLRKKGGQLYKELFEKGDLFLPISRKWKEELIRQGCPEEKIIVHRMGIDIEKFNFIKRGITKNGNISLLSVARLVEKKGVQYAIRAVAKIVKQFPGLEYKIAGDGPLRKDLQILIKDLNLNKHVRLLGWREHYEIADLMDQADILLAPSITGDDGDQEGIPVVLMEAFARGLPVISSYHSGIPELVKNGISGFLVPERDVNALEKKIKCLIVEHTLREKMALAGRKIVEEYYNITKLNSQLEKVYKRLLG